MEILDLENIAKKENIDIINYKMKNTKARIINYCGKYIFMDYSKIKTYTEEKCLLAEELGHYYYDSYYYSNSSQLFIDKQEYKALKWRSITLVTVNSFIKCFKKGIFDLFNISEELQVEPDMVDFAYRYYRENNML